MLTAAGGYRLLEDGAAGAAARLPAPGQSGIAHIVVVMMENRSFDHFFGWMPRCADGKQAGLTYVDRYGCRTRPTTSPRSPGCGSRTPTTATRAAGSSSTVAPATAGCAPGSNDSLSVGYYEQADLQFLGQAAPGWTTCDRYFSAVMAETYPNRFYLHCAQTDRLHNSDRPTGAKFTLPSIWDRLRAKHVSGKYYFSDVPFTFLMRPTRPPAHAWATRPTRRPARSSPTQPRAPCPTCPTSTRSSSTRTAACRTTTTRTPTSEPGRCS